MYVIFKSFSEVIKHFFVLVVQVASPLFQGKSNLAQGVDEDSYVWNESQIELIEWVTLN